jgi:hypothetical protein
VDWASADADADEGAAVTKVSADDAPADAADISISSDADPEDEASDAADATDSVAAWTFISNPVAATEVSVSVLLVNTAAWLSLTSIRLT